MIKIDQLSFHFAKPGVLYSSYIVLLLSLVEREISQSKKRSDVLMRMSTEINYSLIHAMTRIN
uniref:Uncharacterized protein n=1 Tax=Oryza meridionalis TaxID=40149 RepID=A0A0E0F0E4_9ORYZ